MGQFRWVFEHPEDQALLIKVIRTDLADANFRQNLPWYKRRRRYGRYISYTREIQEYIASYATYNQALFFLQKIIGLVETDYGLGLVTEAARDANGQLAPSIERLIKAGDFTASVQKDLEVFLQRIFNCDVIFNDLTARNIVYAFTQEHGHHCILIDGLGNVNPFPLRVLSQRINRRSKNRRFIRLNKEIKTLLEESGYPLPENE